MNAVVRDVVAFCRLFASYERDDICCGDVTVAQCVLLQTLLEGSWDGSSLAEHTRVTKGAMTRLLDGLQRRGWVERVQDESDRRRYAIELTEEGRAEATRLAEMTERSVERIMAQIPSGERRQVAASIATLRVAIESVRDELDCC